MTYLGLLLALSLGLGALSSAEVLTDISGTTSLTLDPTSDGINVELLRSKLNTEKWNFKIKL